MVVSRHGVIRAVPGVARSRWATGSSLFAAAFVVAATADPDRLMAARATVDTLRHGLNRMKCRAQELAFGAKPAAEDAGEVIGHHFRPIRMRCTSSTA
jgi:hypothetical protein